MSSLFNPFPLLSEAILKEKIASGKRWFVRQTYPRGLTDQPGLRAAFLFRAYGASEKNLTDQHLLHIKNDGNARLYDVELEEDRRKLQIAARQPAGFRVYYAGTLKTKWKPPVLYETRIKNYIRTYHPDWRPRGKNQQIQVGLHEQYGALFLKLSFEEDEEMIPFELIEKS